MESLKGNTSYGQCRCCLSKGHHKDIMKEYFWNGIREVYFDMFLECFNLFLSTNENISTLICSSCVQRLRDANNFRMLVMNTEERLSEIVRDNGTVFVNVPVGDHVVDNISDVKEEEQMNIKGEPLIEDSMEYESDNDADDDNLLSAVSEEKNIHQENGHLVKGEAEFLARFIPGSVKSLPNRNTLYETCVNFVRHLDSLKGKTILPSMITQLLEETENKKPFYCSKKVFVTEKMAHTQNISTLIENSNVTPFKSKNRIGFPCFYCRYIYENVDKLREHQIKEHDKTKVKNVLNTHGVECLVVYVDITDLKCTVCNENIPNLNELKSHLTNKHKKKMYLEFTDRIIPFKLTSELYECQICRCHFETFGSIERHMNVHYRNYICKQCGTGFVTKYRLKVHIKSMHMDGNFPCEICKKVFTSQQKHKNHVDTVHKMLKRFKCPKCPERFSEYFRRQKHMVNIHGVAPLQYKCNVCDKSFDRRYTLSRHLKRDHLEERDYQCQLCSYRCFTNNELTVHMVKHNGERIFECSVCKKSYARKKTLKEHMRIHNNDRRFSCAVCGQAFVQKCSLKGHIKTHHLDYSLDRL